MRKYFTITGLSLAAFSIPSHAEAHVRWFVNASNTATSVFQFDMLFAIILTGALIFITLALFLDNLGHEHNRFNKIIHKPAKLPIHIEWQLISIALGAMLLMNSYHSVLLAPNLKPDTSFWSDIALSLQIIVGFLLISQLSYVLSALGILALALICLTLFPMDLMIDYLFEFGAVIIAFYFIGPTVSRIDALVWTVKSWHERAAVCALVTGLGLQLLELSIHNKLTNPGLVLKFVNDHSYLNFILGMGMNQFTNMHFSFAGGIAELAFGVLLVLGIAIRFTGLAIATVFCLSAAIFGLEEFLGHLPIITIALLIILRGNQGNLIVFLSHLKPKSQRPILETV